MKNRIGIIALCGVLVVCAGIFVWKMADRKEDVASQKDIASQKNITSQEDIASQINMLQNEPAVVQDEFDVESDLKYRLVQKKANDIVWTLSKDVEINEKFLALFNRRLKEMGYDYQLKFQYLNSEHYDEEVTKVLEDGDTDIAMGGQNESICSNVVSTVCRKGLFLDLSPLLDSNMGEALRQEYEEPLWGSVTVDGTVYTIPNGIYNDGQFCIVVNQKYVGQNAIKAWDGSMDHIAELFQKASENKDESNRLLWTWDASDLANVLGYTLEDGIFFDNSKIEFSNPFSNKKLYDFFSAVNQAKKENYVDEDASFGLDTNYERIREKIAKGQFGILLTKHFSTLDQLDDNFKIYDIPFYPRFSRNGGTNGICAKSKHAKEAFTILSLLHTNDELAHLLLYGEEGKDYSVKNNKIISDEHISMYLIDNLGIFRSAYPDSESQTYTKNIRKEKRDLYRSPLCTPSVFNGFQIDDTVFTEKDIENMSTTERYFSVWSEYDFETAYEKAKETTEKAVTPIMKKVEQQIVKWEG